VDVIRPVSTSHGYRPVVDKLVDDVCLYDGWDLIEFQSDYPFILDNDLRSLFLTEFFRKHISECGMDKLQFIKRVIPTNLDMIAELYDRFDESIQKHIHLKRCSNSFLYNYTFEYYDMDSCFRFRSPISKFKLTRCEDQSKFNEHVEKEYLKFIENTTLFMDTLHRFKDNLGMMNRYHPYQLTSSGLKRVNMFLNKHSITSYGNISEFAAGNLMIMEYDTKILTVVDYDQDAASKFRNKVRSMGVRINKSPVNFTFNGLVLKLYQTKSRSEIIINCTMNKPQDFGTSNDDFDCIYLILSRMGKLDDFFTKMEPHVLMGI